MSFVYSGLAVSRKVNVNANRRLTSNETEDLVIDMKGDILTDVDANSRSTMDESNSDKVTDEVKVTNECVSENVSVTVKSECSDVSDDSSKSICGNTRENRLTTIIDQLRCANKLKGEGGGVGGGGGGGGRRCVRDAQAPSPAHAPPSASPVTAVPQPQPHTQPPQIKSERLSPHDNQSSASRSRSVTPSTSSYPDTPPERGSPHAPAATAPLTATAPPPPAAAAAPPRNYSDIMRSLAARYNSPQNNYYFHRMNGFGSGASGGMESRVGGAMVSPVRAEAADAPLGGLFTAFARKQGGPPRLPAFPDILDMSSTKTLLAMSRVGRGGRESRRRRYGSGSSAAGPDHSPLDLSAASENAAKRARLSASPSTRSDCDDRASSDDRTEGRGECLCAEARARLSSWTVNDVCDFVNSIDICAEYVTNFREQRIDGAGLPLLTEDHLTGMLQMKLGPALKLRAVLSTRLGPCGNCQNGTHHAPSGKINGSAAVKSEPRSNTTSPS